MLVFIENEAHSRIKNTYDEKTLAFLKSETVSAPYPYPYGFVLSTVGSDGDNVDCFVVTDQSLAAGSIIECQAIDILEQVEDGELDHKIIAVPKEQPPTNRFSTSVERKIRSFIQNVFSHIPGKEITLGKLLGARAAEQYISECTDRGRNNN